MKLPVISPTQVSTWRTCKRKFAFTYLTGEPRPEQTKAQRIGVALHSRVERFFQTGEPDYTAGFSDEEHLAARLLPHLIGKLPPGALSEQKVVVHLGGVEFGGRFDWLTLDPIELGDLKTTSNMVYAKTAKELSTDPQPLIYGSAVALDNQIPLDQVACRWVYVQTKGFPRVHEVEFRPDPSGLVDLIQDGQEIVDAWTNRPKPADLEPNTSACDLYGGCPFRSKCYIDPAERLAQLQRRMGLVTEKIMGQKTFEEMMAEANGIEEVAVNPPCPSPAVVAAAEQFVKSVVRKEEISQPAQPAQDVAAQAPQVAAPDQPKPKRGRKPKDTDPAPAPSADDPEKPIGLLLVSCVMFPTQVSEQLDLIVADVRAEINEKAGVEDYRLIEFGKGAGLLVAGVEERVRALKPAVLYLDSRTPEGRILQGPLVALAKQTIQGV